MKRFLTLSLIIIFINQALSQNIKEYYFKFEIQDKSELDKITRIISIDNVRNKTVYAYALQHELDQFLDMGYQVEYIEKQTPKSISMATTVAEMSNWDKYPTYEVYRQMMKNFQTNFPDICKLDSIGTTRNGRQLYVLKISDNVHSDEAEPEFFYTGTMHGDETTGFILLLRLADSLLTSYNSVDEIKQLIDSIEIYINPNANPDGTYAGGNSTVANATRTNGYADLNRDFPDPNNGANSPYQPETQAMMDFAEERNFTISANFHGGAEVMNYPWDTWYLSENPHTDTDWFEKVCTDYVATARTVYSSYMTDVTSDGVTHGASWYIVNGSRQDYMNYWHQCREITIELSSAKLLSSENLNKYWNYNKQALINFIKESLYGIKGTVKNTDGEPIHGMIWVNNHDQGNDSSMVFSDPDFGNYYRPIESGNYSITASANGYLPTTVENINVDWENIKLVNFILQKADSCTITGTITDSDTGTPIENANIKLSNFTEFGGLTNSNGEYFIKTIEGNYSLMVEKKGYAIIKTDIELRLSDTIYDSSLYKAETEDFESNSFDSFNWQHGGNSQWTISNTESYEGNYTAKSGVISHNQSSTLSLDVNIKTNGTLSFYKKVSSETGYDFLRFYIDDVEQQKWSGQSDWSIEHFEIDSGEHTLKWAYTKDQAVSEGNDCAWIDMISIPEFANETDSISIQFNFSRITETLELGDSVSRSLVLSNLTENELNYSVSIDYPSKSESWIKIDKQNGYLSSLGDDTIQIILSGKDQAVGTYNCLLQITINETNESAEIPVTLEITQTQNITKAVSLSNLKIYPNPMKSYLEIDFYTQQQSVFIELYNIYGENLFKQKYNTIPGRENHITIYESDLKNKPLQKGVYFIQLKTSSNSLTKKLLKD